MRHRIASFQFEPNVVLADKYRVLDFLGSGWEGEVYRVRELSTGVVRAAKFFFPHRNLGNRAVKFYARKLHKLRHCPILIQYHTQERLTFEDTQITVLVSEFVEGEMLKNYIKKRQGKRLPVFEAMHVLHALSVGVEKIHQLGEYHGDLHSGNIIIKRRGIAFDVKLFDLFNQGPPGATRIADDVCDLIRLFYDLLGGAPTYAKHPPEVKAICCGLKRSLILKKFKNAGALTRFLQSFPWE